MIEAIIAKQLGPLCESKSTCRASNLLLRGALYAQNVPTHSLSVKHTYLQLLYSTLSFVSAISTVRAY